MRPIRVREKGVVPAFLLTTVVFLLAAIAVFFLFRWYWGGPEKPPGPLTPVTPFPAAQVFSGDPAAATEKLLRALNRKLSDQDLLKLLDREVETRSTAVQGKLFSSYTETFRWPIRFTPEQLAEQLNEAAKPLGAKLTAPPVRAPRKGGGFFYRCDFAYDSQWVPVELVFEETGQPRICLIIDDGGYQRGEALETLYRLKIPLTVAIIPDAEFSTPLAEELPGRGVEVMCHMPMEGHEKGMVGDHYKELLKPGMDHSKARAAVEKALDSLPQCRGLNNHMGSVATTDPELIWDVCQVLKTRGLFIIDSRTTAQSVVEPVANKAHVAVAHRDVFLDNVETPEAILKQMDQLEARARRKGTAVGIGHFKLKTLATLEGVVGGLREKGFQFVFASEVVKE